MVKIHREVIGLLSSLGARDLRLEGGKHYKLRYTYQGRSCMLTMARSPSDYRFLRNVVRDFKREVRRRVG
jgi:hypothetical protein